MKNIWQNLIIKILVWLAAEVLLTFLGLDDIADYSEFVEKQSTLVLINQGQELIL